MSKIWLSKIEINDGTEIILEKNDIVVFVGPNNAGKSASLKEINLLLIANNKTGIIIKDIEIENEGTVDELITFMGGFSKIKYGSNPRPHYEGYGYNIYEDNAKGAWSNYKNGLGQLHQIFVNLLSTEGRLSTANPAVNIDITTQSPQNPIHFLQFNDSLEKKFSEYFKQAFGEDLIVDRGAGGTVPLFVGKKPKMAKGEDRVSSGYLEKLHLLSLLHLQGDGMRSFVGVLLHAFIANHSIQLIDEPEAFLHPPQARLLGKMLAKDLPSDRQLFLSTHSEDFLKGLLDSGNPNIKVIRIRREGAINRVHQLDKNDIKEIWSDSLLRHSNILNGLFHTKVVICESDSDCRFYSAILFSLFEDKNEISPDFLFIHCGGKHRIPTVVKALKKLDVPIKIVTDFDILNDTNPLKEIYCDLGGKWPSIENDWKIVKNAIEEKRPELLADDVKREIGDVFNLATDRIFNKENINRIQKILKKASAWSEAKSVGRNFIPNGNAIQAFERIQIKLKEKGLLVLEVGELESFVKSIGNHGPKWVNEVLMKDLKNDPELDIARQFVLQFVN
jgi:energy-coupling factor transporter ATP-binding protein EcfA2